MYRENLQMNEALALHAARVQELETRTERLEAANRSGRIDRLVLKFMFTIIMHCYIPVGSITGPSCLTYTGNWEWREISVGNYWPHEYRV